MANNVLNQLKSIFAEILLCSEGEISLVKPYVDMGVDSILAIQISKLIKIKFDLEITPSELYNFISIQGLADYIEKKLNAPTQDNVSLVPNENSLPEKSFVDTKEKVAIIGIAGIFPKSKNVQEYWDNLISAKCLIRTSSRWNNEKEHAFKGGFIDNIDQFDSDFFNISPNEAKMMDPQQRLLLQVSWQAFEDSGFRKEDLNGINCGVFTTSLPGDYKYLLQKEGQAYNTFSFAGNAVSVNAGRISHFFNLKGPSLSIDTACSSSLICIDQAVKHLQSGHCELALVGAASIFSTPEIFKLAEASNLISKEGYCFTFDKRADGFIPAEAAACLVLKRYSDAQRDGQNIYGIIEALETNHDGFTNGLMSPNGHSQQSLITATYKKGKINPSEVAYIEAHGTGTQIGDPLEFNALRNAFEELNRQKYSCFIGSSKANVGHALVASGLVSLIKVVLSFKHNIIPPQVNFQEFNPQINPGNFSINTEKQKWPKDKNLAGISAFGFSGTNAHLVLRKPEEPLSNALITEPLVFVISSKTRDSLIKLLKSYIDFLENNINIDLLRLSYTLCKHRTFFDFRFATICQKQEDLIDSITNFINSEEIIMKESFLEDHSSNHKEILVKNFLGGESVDFTNFFENQAVVMPLPCYPFHTKRHWIEKTLNLTEESKNNEIIAPDILSILKGKIADCLGYDIKDIFDQAPLESFGIDSLVALQVLEPFKQFIPSLNSNLIFTEKNLLSLTERLTQLMKTENLKKNTIIESKDDTISQKEPSPSNLSATQLEWNIYGNEKGRSLLLLPPLNTLSHIWTQQIRFFVQKGYRVFIPHYPGHGQSQYGEEDLNEIADIIWNDFHKITTNMEKISLMGWSLGGCLSLILATKHPDEIDKILLISTAASFENDLFSQSACLRDELLKKEGYLKHLLNHSNQGAIESISAGCSLDVLKHYYDQLQKFDLTKSLPTILKKCLVFHGSRDAVIQKKDIENLKLIQDASIEVFEEEGHFIPLMAPYRFNNISEKFISGEL